MLEKFRAARTVLITLCMLSVATVPMVGSATDGAEASSASDRMIVGFHDLPDRISEGSTYQGAEVVDVNRVLDAVAVETHERGDFTSAARQDDRVRYVDEGNTFYPTETPNDPLFAEQYGPQQMRAPEAWDTTTGRTARNVCVVDSGVRYTHEDLAGPRWLGGVDLVNDDGDPWDDRGHGTHVTGIAAAGVDNGAGIAGVGEVGFLHVKVFGPTGGADVMDLATAIQWCADNGGDVISMSLGARAPDPLTMDAVDYAESEGSVLVAAAGNDGCRGCVNYPAGYDETIAVTCVDGNRSLCRFSSYGPGAELTAAGSGILSTIDTGDDDYTRISGTSMSTPHVSGVASLVWSAFPDLTNEQVREILQTTAQDVGPDGWDQRFGFGIPNASAALDAALQTLGGFPCDVVDPAGDAAVSGTVTVEAESTASVTEIPLRVDGELVDTLEPTSEDATTFAGELEATEYADGLRDVEVTCDDGQGNARDVPLKYVFDNARAAILEPADRGTVAGTEEVVVEAASERGGADEVFVSIDGGPEVDVSGNRETGTDNYTLEWDTTTHENEAVPARIDARFLDHGGYETEAREIEVEVDNRPDPTAEITDPEPDEQIVGPHRIWVEADSGVDREGFRVEVKVNEGPWRNVTDNREGEDRYYYDWHGQTATHRTVIQARTVDHGGRALDAVQVNVTGAGTALAAAEPYEQMVWGCIDKLSPLSPSVNPSCDL